MFFALGNLGKIHMPELDDSDSISVVWGNEIFSTSGGIPLDSTNPYVPFSNPPAATAETLAAPASNTPVQTFSTPAGTTNDKNTVPVTTTVQTQELFGIGVSEILKGAIILLAGLIVVDIAN